MTLKRMDDIVKSWPPVLKPSSLAERTICRQSPELRAECVNRACSDLCGGRSVMGVPTAVPDPAGALAPARKPDPQLHPATNPTFTCRPARTASVTSMSRLNCCHLPRTRSLTRD